MDRGARSALAALCGCLLGSAAADTEVALSLLRVLEVTGLVQLFAVIVRPVFRHASWMQVVPQLLARIAHPQFGPVVAEILQTVAEEGGNAQSLFWSVRTARDGGGWKQEQRDQADLFLRWLTLRHPALCGGCTLLFEGLQSLGALWEERWQRALKVGEKSGPIVVCFFKPLLFPFVRRSFLRCGGPRRAAAWRRCRRRCSGCWRTPSSAVPSRRTRSGLRAA